MQEERDEGAEARDLPGKVRPATPETFDRLFARYRDYLHEVIRMRMDPTIGQRLDPSDIVQETHLEAVRQWPEYVESQPMPPRLWLRHIACQKLLMARRRHGGAARRAMHREVALPERSSLQLAEQLMAGGSSPSQHFAKRELAQIVRQVVAQLPEADREILLMRFFEGLSNREVSQVLGIGPAAVSMRQGRALVRLHDGLVNRGLGESRL